MLEKLDEGLSSSGVNGGVDTGTGTGSPERVGLAFGRELKYDPGVPIWVLIRGNCAGLPVTQTDDPPSGGHFLRGASKTPPCPATERSAVKIFVFRAMALDVANGHNGCVSVESPISNGRATVGGAKTRSIRN